MSTERILVYGYPGSGKSYQFLKIADFVRPTGAQCYVLDTDDAYSRLLETEFRHLAVDSGGNVHVFPAFDWQEWEEGFVWISEQARPGDWVCIDRADQAWEAVQEYYVTQVFGQKMGDFFLKARTELEEALKKNPKAKQVVLEGDKDWQVINRLYKQEWFQLIRPSFPANLYVVTAASTIEKRDESIIKETYGWIGAKPTGQKHLAHQTHTNFYFAYTGDEWRVTTVKDRGRKHFDHQKLVSLPHQYLLSVAGWKR